MRARSSCLLGLLLLLAAAPLGGQGAEPAPAPLLAAAGPIPDYRDRPGLFARDKFYHFGVSAVGSGALYAGGRRVGLGRLRALAASALVMGAAGVWREVGTTDRDDLLTRQKASRGDLVWDAVGIAAGLAVADRWLGARTGSGAPLPEPPPPPPVTAEAAHRP